MALSNLKPTVLILIKEPAGMVILDRPSSRSAGAIQRRAVGVGTILPAYKVLKFDGGVPYAWLVPRVDTQPEWIRMEEAGHTHVYAEVVAELEEEGSNSSIGSGLHAIANAIRYFADKYHG